MSRLEFEILLIAMVVGMACALPGCFLVLRRMSMLTDAISHTVLLGIVMAFLVVSQYDHPLLVLGAAGVGVLTVILIELLGRTRLIKEDAAIGITFPALFSLGVLLISLLARDAHLDEHTVFQGDLVYAVFERFRIGGVALGPLALWKLTGILVLNAALIVVFFKELKISTFDPDLALALGFAPALLHYGLVALTSITAVGAFDAVGSILVIGFMIVPPVTASLLTTSLSRMLWLALGVSLLSAVSGFGIATLVDASIGGAMTLAMAGILGIVLLAAPQKGLVAATLRRRRQKWQFAIRMLSIHLFQHLDAGPEGEENRVDHLQRHLAWSVPFATRILRMAQAQGIVEIRDERWIHLTEQGKMMARSALTV